MSKPCLFSHSLTALLLSERTLSTSLSAGDFQILKFINLERIVLTLSCSAGVAQPLNRGSSFCEVRPRFKCQNGDNGRPPQRSIGHSAWNESPHPLLRTLTLSRKPACGWPLPLRQRFASALRYRAHKRPGLHSVSNHNEFLQTIVRFNPSSAR